MSDVANEVLLDKQPGGPCQSQLSRGTIGRQRQVFIFTEKSLASTLSIG